MTNERLREGFDALQLARLKLAAIAGCHIKSVRNQAGEADILLLEVFDVLTEAIREGRP